MIKKGFAWIPAKQSRLFFSKSNPIQVTKKRDIHFLVSPCGPMFHKTKAITIATTTIPPTMAPIIFPADPFFSSSIFNAPSSSSYQNQEVSSLLTHPIPKTTKTSANNVKLEKAWLPSCSKTADQITPTSGIQH